MIQITYLLALWILYLFEPEFNAEMNTDLLKFYSLTFLFAFAVHLYSLRKESNWFRLDIIFILGFGIVHYQWPIMITFSDIIPGRLSRNIDISYYMNYGTWMSTIGIISWLLGFSLFKTATSDFRDYYLFKYSKLYWVTTAFFIIFVLLSGANYLSGAVYKSQGGSAHGGGISVYFQLLFSILILILTSIVILNKKNVHNKSSVKWWSDLDKKYLILITVTVLLFLSVGDRGGALQPAMTFLILYGALVKPIKIKEFVFLIVLGALIMTLIGLGRGSDSNDNILIAGASNIDVLSQYAFTLELSDSVRTLYKSLSFVPEHHDFFLGKLWLGTLLAVIPLSQSLYLIVSNDVLYEMSSSAYITFLTRGLNPKSGEGTTIIADIFLNFGLFGVILFMLILGLFFKKVTNELILQRNHYWIVAAAVLAGYAFYMGRGGLFYPMRPILWALFLTWLLVDKKEKT